MRIQVTVGEQDYGLEVPWRLLAALLAASLLWQPAAAWAADAFSDVGDSHPFHDEIGWMADNGVSTGFPDGTYRPNDPVTRQAMAAFMERLDSNDVFTTFDEAVNIAHVSGTFPTSQTNPDNFTLPSSTISITIPSGHTADVLLEFSAESLCTTPGSGADWCGIRFLQNGTQTGFDDLAFDSTDGATEGTTSWESHSTRYVVEGLAAGTYEFAVVLKHFDGGTDDDVTFRLDDWVFTAEAIVNPA